VAEGIVDALQAVQIQADDRHGLLVAGSLGEHPFRGLDAALSVGQRGQRVEIGQSFDARGRRGERARGGSVAQYVFEPPRQQRPVHGFGNEVRGARLEGEGNRFGILVAGHHDNGNGGEARLATQAAADFVAIHAGHVDVEQYEGDVPARCRVERIDAIVVAQRCEPDLHQGFGQQQTSEFFVVGDDGQRA
jgi:hypothetical protein